MTRREKSRQPAQWAVCTSHFSKPLQTTKAVSPKVEYEYNRRAPITCYAFSTISSNLGEEVGVKGGKASPAGRRWHRWESKNGRMTSSFSARTFKCPTVPQTKQIERIRSHDSPLHPQYRWPGSFPWRWWARPWPAPQSSWRRCHTLRSLSVRILKPTPNRLHVPCISPNFPY